MTIKDPEFTKYSVGQLYHASRVLRQYRGARVQLFFSASMDEESLTLIDLFAASL
jgi:hypothetical protein